MEVASLASRVSTAPGAACPPQPARAVSPHHLPSLPYRRTTAHPTPPPTNNRPLLLLRPRRWTEHHRRPHPHLHLRLRRRQGINMRRWAPRCRLRPPCRRRRGVWPGARLLPQWPSPCETFRCVSYSIFFFVRSSSINPFLADVSLNWHWFASLYPALLMR